MRINLLFTAVLGSFLLLSGCSSHKNFGKLVEQHEVTRVFRAFTVYDNYNYYYYGIFEEPDTIMGIDKRYNVVSKFWTPVDLTPEQLERWVIDLDRIRGDRNFSSRYMGRYQGAYILDPNGTQVGIWYSKLDWGVFEFPEENVMVPYVPSRRPGMEWPRYRDD